MSNFLYKNIMWTFNRKNDENLLTLPTTESQYITQLEKLAEKYYPEKKQIDFIKTEFYLNQVALLRSKNNAAALAKNRFENQWYIYCKLRNAFDKKYLTFPSNGTLTRIELAAELITKCTQFAVDENTLLKLIDYAVDIMQLDEKEAKYLPLAVDMYKLTFYCKATLAASRGKKSAERALAKMLRPALLTQVYTVNKTYLQAAYGNGKLLSVVDCMGGSATRFDEITTGISAKLYVYANGRNVFDTFVKSRFGNNVAEFTSQANSLDIKMRYFIVNNTEIRKVSITNLCKVRRKFSAEVITAKSENATYFNMGGALGISADGERLYAACALVRDNAVIDCNGSYSQCCDFSLAPNEQAQFDIVTVYAHNAPDIAKELDNLRYFGATECPYVKDAPSNTLRRSNIELNLSAHGYTLKKPRKVMSSKINFTYQLGDCDEATFVDNAGNSATLIKGFVFGVGGESVYSVRGGLIDKINEGSFHIDVDSLRYDKSKSACVVRHNEGKTYEVTYKNPCKTLFLFPFERASRVRLQDNAFYIEDEERRYSVYCQNEIDSYTTNALECNEDRLRYKLSGDLNAGSCLAICFKQSDTVKLTIKSHDKTPVSNPIVRESLVSTYLNYINDKNAFCLNNFIKRPDSLTAAAICYTNPQFVKKYLTDRFKTQQNGYYYNASGLKTAFTDKLGWSLAYAYFRNLVDDELPASYLNAVNGVIFGERFEGKDLCVKALILKKLAQLNNEDKVRYLVEYNFVKKQISNDSKLYGYAQAIGALPMINPSKARLKDLCSKYGIEKCWYYVSQLENLYGLTISPGKLNVCPKVTAENVLEQLALNINGRRIDTTFAKSTVQSMTLNGMQCFQPFCPASLKKVNNELVVRY